MNALTQPPSAHQARFAAWRDQRLARLHALGSWLRQSAVPPALWQDTIEGLERRLRRDLVQLALVAEFSRGKSELINAVFFADTGMRVLPAGAGRTTMCPVELGCDPGRPPSLRLLPIETRLDPALLAQWKQRPEAWQELLLDPEDPQATSRVLLHLTDSVEVTPERARELGFPDPVTPGVRADGQIEIPRWRHALLNVDHPLLAQGLAVLDTPGLNSLGAEPELTLSLIPAASAVVFMLGADTGVTRSDLDLWTGQLGEAARSRALVVLNKVDLLWDPLLSEDEVQAQIARQRASVAGILGVPLQRVFAISAHKALLARIRGDQAMLERSGLPVLEAALARIADDERRDLVDVAWRETLLNTLMEAERQLQQQIQEVDDQCQELGALEGRNKAMVRSLAGRIGQEKDEFDACIARLQALHGVNARHLDTVAMALRPAPVLEPLDALRRRLRNTVLKTGLRAAIDAAIEQARQRLAQVDALLREDLAMLEGAADRFNTEFAFTVPAPRGLKLEGVALDLDELERDVQRYLTPARWLTLQNTAAAERVVSAAASRLRALLERGLREVQDWNRSALAPLDAQVRERRTNLARRVQSLQQVQGADGDLGSRIAQLRGQAGEMRAERVRMRRYFEGAMK